MIDSKELNNERVTAQLRRPQNAPHEPWKTLFSIVHGLLVKKSLFARGAQRRNEALPITKDQYIPNAIEIWFKSFDHPIDIIILTVLGFSLNFENQQLCFENEKVGLLLHLWVQNWALHFAPILCKDRILISVDVNHNVLQLVLGELYLLHALHFH